MLRIFPYGALQFTSFEVFKKLLPQLNLPLLGADSHIMKFVAGALAGVISVSATFPLDTIRARLAFQVDGEVKYSGIVNAATVISKSEGVIGLYRGLSPTVIGIVPYAGLSFYCFERLKSFLLSQWCWARAAGATGDQVQLTVPAKELQIISMCKLFSLH